MALISSIRQGPVRLGWSAIPGLMRVGVLFSTFMGALLLLIVPLGALNIGSYSIDERTVSGPYFLLHIYPIVAPYLILLLAITYGIWAERLWVRPVALVFWLALDLILVFDVLTERVTSTDAFAYAAWAVVYILIVWWYFYRKATVLSYYRRLASARSASRAGA